MTIRITLELLRVNHWIKNLLLFFPLIFSGKLTDENLVAETFAGFIAFSLVASAIYIINDLKDLDFDRLHPVKKLRPLATGKVAVKTAIAFSSSLLIAGGFVSLLLGYNFSILVLGYVILNISYTNWLKNFAIIDISVISFGYILRIFAGGVIGAIPISHWLGIMTFLTAMFLVLAKRRSDLLLLENGYAPVRKSIHGYNVQFTNVALSVFASIIIVAYAMYTVSTEVIERVGSMNLYFTAIPVTIGILRYLQLTIVEDSSDDPVKVLLTDKVIIVMTAIWLLSFLFILYGKSMLG